MQLAEWALQGGEVARVQHQNAGNVIAIERGDQTGASSGDGIFRITEPYPQVVHVHRGCRGIRHGVDARIRLRRRSAVADSEYVAFAAEDPDELARATPASPGVDLALVLGHPEGEVRDL
jgi:hypothetical protein